MAMHQLSLVAQFDDLMRNNSVLTAGIESEFLKFVQNQEEHRKKWAESGGVHKDCKDKIERLEENNKALETKLKHARNTIDVEMRKKLKVEQERDSLERQINLVRELLLDKNNRSVLNDHDRERLAFLNSTAHLTRNEPSPRKSLSVINETGSLLSEADISYDKTEEDLDGAAEMSYLRSGKPYKRPSAPPMAEEEDITPPGKKSRKEERRRRRHRRSRSASAAVVATTTINMTNDAIHADAEITTPDGRKKKKSVDHRMKRHHSEKNLKDKNYSDDSYITAKSGHTPYKSKYNRSPASTPENQMGGMRHYGSNSSLHRPHYFVQKTVIKPESCNPCGKRVKFGKPAMKCRDCRATAHPECKELVPLPCVPTLSTPGTASKQNGYITDYAPNDPPMIPGLVIYCVNEVEARGLGEKGIYRVPGSDKEVKDLKEKFLRGREPPNLSHIDDIHVVCGCIKDFLRNLKEPLVTYKLWKDFVNAALYDDEDESNSLLYQAISQLPQPNRDTLAFVILHLQRVSESVEAGMNKTNLSRVFGPTLVGYSCSDPEPLQIMQETTKQSKVMERLISISGDYWTTFINIDAERTMFGVDNYISNTPEARPAPYSMLGGVHTPDDTDRKSSWFGTPKFSNKTRTVNKKHFFTSPSLK